MWVLSICLPLPQHGFSSTAGIGSCRVARPCGCHTWAPAAQHSPSTGVPSTARVVEVRADLFKRLWSTRFETLLREHADDGWHRGSRSALGNELLTFFWVIIRERRATARIEQINSSQKTFIHSVATWKRLCRIAALM